MTDRAHESHPKSGDCRGDLPPAPDCGFSDADKQDIAWMERVRRGDMEAFEKLIETHQKRVIGTVAKMLGDEVDAEDIAQQVFIRLWNSAARYEPSAKFTTWLFTIVRNLSFNEIRRRSRHPAASVEREQEEHALQIEDSRAKSPFATILETEMQTAIQAAIDSLPEVQRMAVVLRRYQDVSYEEIGEILKLSVPAVKSVLFRARMDLREKLKRYLDGG